jgi:hypothetical protein
LAARAEAEGIWSEGKAIDLNQMEGSGVLSISELVSGVLSNLSAISFFLAVFYWIQMHRYIGTEKAASYRLNMLLAMLAGVVLFASGTLL